MITAVLIIFSVILQTVINAIMLSTGGQGAARQLQVSDRQDMGVQNVNCTSKFHSKWGTFSPKFFQVIFPTD